MSNVSDKRCRENLNTHFMLNNFFENRSAYGIMEKNTAKPERLLMTIWRTRIACPIRTATNTHSEYVTHCFSIATIFERISLSVTLYVYYPSCLCLISSDF